MKTLQKTFPAVLLVCLLAAVLALAPAARALHVDTRGSLTLTLSPVDGQDRDGTAKHTAIEATEFTGRLYRIASVNESYYYTPAPGFEALAGEDVRNFKDKKADELRTLAQTAASLAADAEPAKTLTFRSGSAGASDLETGLYLLVIDTFTTADSIWNVSCEPTLLPVPVVNGEVNGSWDGSDNYDVAAALKLTAEKALTKIKITKQLTDYSALQGPASFVFKVEAVNAGGENVFSNVYAMTFTGAAAQELVIENIPVDSTVTVTEVYSGASYTPDGSGEIQLTARPMVKNSDGSETLPAENEAAFVNRYNRRRTYGTAVTNAFSYADGQWQLTQNYSNK